MESELLCTMTPKLCDAFHLFISNMTTLVCHLVSKSYNFPLAERGQKYQLKKNIIQRNILHLTQERYIAMIS